MLTICVFIWIYKMCVCNNMDLKLGIGISHLFVFLYLFIHRENYPQITGIVSFAAPCLTSTHSWIPLITCSWSEGASTVSKARACGIRSLGSERPLGAQLVYFQKPSCETTFNLSKINKYSFYLYNFSNFLTSFAKWYFAKKSLLLTAFFEPPDYNLSQYSHTFSS